MVLMLGVFVDMARDAIGWADLSNRPRWQWPFVLVRVGWFLCEMAVVGLVIVGPLVGGAVFVLYLAYVGLRRLLGY